MDRFVHAQCGEGLGFEFEFVHGGIDFLPVVAQGRGLQAGDQAFEAFLLCFIEQLVVGFQRRLHGFDQALGFDLRFLQRATQGILAAVSHRGLEHAGDFVVGKSVGGLDRDAGFDAGERFPG